MTLCPCPCKQPVKPGNKYAGKGCSLRAIPREVKAERMRERCRRLGLAHKRWAGSKGGRESDIERWSRLLEKWQDMKPREALREAYFRGYRSGYTAARRGYPNRHERGVRPQGVE